MKYFILLIVVLSFGSIIYGFNLDTSQEALAHRFIGSGTLAIFLIAMPLFLFTESKGKKFKDYMLTEESVRKMQGKEPKNLEEGEK